MKSAAWFKAMVLGVTACGVLAVSHGARSGEMSMDISGKWRLNKKLSDDPRQVMKEQREKMMEKSGRGGGGLSGGAGGGVGGGRDGYGGRGGGRGGGGRVGMAEQQQQEIEEMGRALAMLKIAQEEGVVTLIDGINRETTLKTDGEERELQTPRGLVKAYASWVDLALVVHTTTKDERRFTRTYRINDDGRLEVVTKINPRRMPEPIQFVAVYDLEPSVD